MRKSLPYHVKKYVLNKRVRLFEKSHKLCETEVNQSKMVPRLRKSAKANSNVAFSIVKALA